MSGLRHPAPRWHDRAIVGHRDQALVERGIKVRSKQ